MPDLKFSERPEATVASGGDGIPIIEDIGGGTPVSKWISPPNLFTSLDGATREEVAQAVATVSGNTPQISALVSGGQVVWESAYTFRVSAAVYYILGELYSSGEQTVTLDAAHATLDRIDVLALDASGVFVKIAGTAAAQPSEPDVDPTTQLKLTFVLVTADTTEPAGVSNESIYLENTEWTSSTSGSGWNANSTTNPRTGSKTIEGTNVANNAYVQLQRGSTLALDAYSTLALFVRSKAAWANNRILRLQFFNAGVAKGSAVTLASGYWGFDSSITSGYQLVAIPLTQFVLPAGTLVNQLRITDSGGSIGLYADDIVLQARGGSLEVPASGLSQTQADARYLQRANNLSDLTDAAIAQAALSSARVNAQVGTTYTVQAGDKGKVITCSNASAITVTVPSGLGAGFNCMVIQKGAGQVTFSASGVTVNQRQGHTKTAGQHAVVSLVADVANNFYLGGDTAS